MTFLILGIFPRATRMPRSVGLFLDLVSRYMVDVGRQPADWGIAWYSLIRGLRVGELKRAVPKRQRLVHPGPKGSTWR